MLSLTTYNPDEMRINVIPVPLVAATCTLALVGCGSSNRSTTSGATAYSSFLRFSTCMRTHGVPNFPDPTPGGGIKLDLGSGIDPQSPAFRSAQLACKHLLPGGGPPSHVPESVKLALIKHAECMRANGVPEYLDPRFPPGGGIETFGGPGVDANTPAFRHAVKACGGHP